MTDNDLDHHKVKLRYPIIVILVSQNHRIQSFSLYGPGTIFKVQAIWRQMHQSAVTRSELRAILKQLQWMTPPPSNIEPYMVKGVPYL